MNSLQLEIRVYFFEDKSLTGLFMIKEIQKLTIIKWWIKITHKKWFLN